MSVSIAVFLSPLADRERTERCLGGVGISIPLHDRGANEAPPLPAHSHDNQLPHRATIGQASANHNDTDSTMFLSMTSK